VPVKFEIICIFHRAGKALGSMDGKAERQERANEGQLWGGDGRDDKGRAYVEKCVLRCR
jgi:hypothetical protein